MSSFNKADGRVRRHVRLRKKVRGTENRPRLAVFKSNCYVYAQVINDKTGETTAAASSLEKEFRDKFGGKLNVEVASIIGKTVGERAKAKGVSTVVFDRGGYIYQGRIKSLADGAREAGLEF